MTKKEKEEELKLINLYQAFESNVDYCSLIESYGKDNITLEECNIDLLKALFAGLYLTLIIDEYAEKKSNDEIVYKFIPGFLDTLVEIIAKNNGKGYTVGNLMYKDASTVLTKIRNKLAHGDFRIEDGYIIYEESKTVGKVKIDDLLKFIATFENSCEKYTLYDSNEKNLFIPCKLSYKVKANDEYSLREMCNNIYKLKLKDTPLLPRTRNYDYIKKIQKIYEMIEQKINIISDPIEINKFIEKIQGQLLLENIKLDFNIIKVSHLDYYNAIKDKYLDQIDVFKNIDIEKQLAIVTHYSYSLGKSRFQKSNIRKGILLNETILNEFEKDPFITLKEAMTANPNYINLYLYDLDEIVLSTHLLCFNSLYEYGLDKNLTIDGKTSIIDLFENKKLDFSRFDLTKFESDSMIIEKHFESGLEKTKKEELEDFKAKIKIIEKSKKEYIKNSKNVVQEKINKFDNEIENLVKTKMERLAYFETLEAYEKNFNKEKYEKNLNIIYHIRNAISHGWIYVDAFTNDIPEKYMVIKDYDKENNLVYTKTIKMKDFYSLFKVGNLLTLQNFYKRNIKTNGIVDDKYIYKVVKRLEYRRR